jgi:hypothetical protein
MYCDLSTIALELIGFTTSLRLYKNYYHRLSVRCLYKNILGLTPHHVVYAYTNRKCQMCKMLKLNKTVVGVGHCVDCNVHLCNECQFEWHNQVLQEHLLATDMYGNKYKLKQSGLRQSNEEDRMKRLLENQSQRFLEAPVDDSLKVLPDELCPQRLDSIRHASLSQQRYGALCILCNGKAGIKRCVKCFIDLCDSCWFVWHPNTEQLCRIIPANCLPLEISSERIDEKKQEQKV